MSMASPESFEKTSELCPVSVANLEHVQGKIFEQTMLKEYLDEDQSLADTIDNLEQLLKKMATVTHEISRPTLFHARRALVSLETLKLTMEGAS